MGSSREMLKWDTLFKNTLLVTYFPNIVSYLILNPSLRKPFIRSEPFW